MTCSLVGSFGDRLLTRLQRRELAVTSCVYFNHNVEDHFIFLGYNGRIVAKNPPIYSPRLTNIRYYLYMRYFSHRFGSVLGLTYNGRI